MWGKASEKFEQEILEYNIRDNSFKADVILSFEFLTSKMVENLPLIDRPVDQKIEPSNKNFQAVFYKKNRNEFCDYWIDFEIYKLKSIRKLNSDQIFPGFKKLNQLEKKMKHENVDFVVEFVLVCFKQNEKFVDDRKIYRLGIKLKEVFSKIEVFEFFTQFLFLILIQKDSLINFNFKTIEFLENWILNNISFLEETNFDCLFGILFNVYCIFCAQEKAGIIYFSGKFMKKFLNLSIWHNLSFWESVIIEWREYLKWNENCYFNDFLSNTFKKRRVKDNIDIFEIVLHLCVIFLKIPVHSSLDLINEINDSKNFTSFENIQKISYEFESKWIETQRIRYTSLSERVIKIPLRPSKVIYALKLTLPFLRNDRSVFHVLFLNKNMHEKFKSAILKQILLIENLNDEIRVKSWLNLAKIHCKEIENEFTKSKLLQVDPKIINIIKMDVKRTNFAKFYAVELEQMLVDLALKFPLVNYYQGMNCIGGFLLNYLDNYEKAHLVFQFLIKKRLTKFFSNNFENLKKLIYICERLVKVFTPKLFAHLEKLNIGNVLYISPFVLTIFTSFLQHFQNYNLLAKIVDVFIAKGWLGLFKVILFIFKQFEDKLVHKNYDQTLIFLNKGIYEYMFQMKFQDLKSDCEKIGITEGQLHQFGMDFDRSRFIIESYWNTYYEKKRMVSLSRERESVQSKMTD